MELKVDQKESIEVLGRGVRTVAEEAIALNFKPELFNTPMEKYRPDKPLFFVLLERVELVESEFEIGQTFKRTLDWKWAYTKQWARDQARAAEAEGWRVVDISKGTISHPSHKFTGLVPIKRGKNGKEKAAAAPATDDRAKRIRRKSDRN